MKRRLLMCGLLAGLVGCGGGGGEGDGGAKQAPGAKAKPSAAPQAAAGAKDWDPSKGTATIQGTVKFTGKKAPRRRKIDMSAQAACAKQHTEPVLDEIAIINDNGTVKNVFVWVKSGLKGWKFPTPSEPVRLNQQGCTFHPHVLGIQTRQKLVVHNSDETLHNLHAMAIKNKEFNFSQPKKGMESEKTFKRPEVMVKVKCDVHGWMGAYIGVVPHPYFAVTGDDGAFVLKNLPPGTYTVEAWHEDFGTKTAQVTVADNESKDITFAFDGK